MLQSLRKDINFEKGVVFFLSSVGQQSVFQAVPIVSHFKLVPYAEQTAS